MYVGERTMFNFTKHKDYPSVEKEFSDVLNYLEKEVQKNIAKDEIVGHENYNLTESIYISVSYFKDKKNYLYNCWIRVDGITISYTDFINKRNGFEYAMRMLLGRLFIQLNK
jgi:hypothetical protein